MSKFAQTRAPVRSPIVTTGPMLTHEGGYGHARDAKGELFLLAVSNLVGEDTFYEPGKARDARYAALVADVTRQDPDWVAALVPWLRRTVNLRSVALVTAAEYVRAGGPGGRKVIADALDRADEPAEMLAYWHQTYGRNVPKPVLRGVRDAVRRLYDERAALRYDGTDRLWRMADVLTLTHTPAVAPWQSALFDYLHDKRHGHRTTVDLREAGHLLPRIAADERLRALPEDARRAALRGEDFTTAGWNWDRLGGWLPGGMDREAWEAVIPQMGIMALLRNLRNFDEKGVSDAVATREVMSRFTDPEQVARSRQLPFRWYSAWREVQSLRWAYPLEQALDLSLANVPSLPGRTLILVDVSYSMHDRISGRSARERWELAGLFGIALAKRAESADLWLYNNEAIQIDHRPPTLRLLDGIRPFVNGGTLTFHALRHTFAGHDRVVLLTDEQAQDAGSGIPSGVKRLYTFNLGGYRPAHAPSGQDGFHTFGGLSDAAFTLIDAIERYHGGHWPHVN